jgi:hypothetical protein
MLGLSLSPLLADFFHPYLLDLTVICQVYEYMNKQHNACHIWSSYAKEGSDLFANIIPQNTKKTNYKLGFFVYKKRTSQFRGSVMSKVNGLTVVIRGLLIHTSCGTLYHSGYNISTCHACFKLHRCRYNDSQQCKFVRCVC